MPETLNAFTETFRRRRDVAWLHTRHEEAAAFAASAEAQLTGRPAACAGSCGPGNLHLINGLYGANRSRKPVVAIALHIPSTEIGAGYFQEINPEHLFEECSVYCGSIRDPSQAARMLSVAIQLALGEWWGGGGGSRRRRLVEVEGEEPRDFTEGRPTLTPPESDLVRAAELIDSAGKVTTFAAAGCADAHDELMALAGKIKALVVRT